MNPVVHDYEQRERMRLGELFHLFHRSSDETRWLGSVDSEEYLHTIDYLVRDPFGVRR